MGHGTLEGGVIEAGATAERKLHTVFDAPWGVLGTCVCFWKGGMDLCIDFFSSLRLDIHQVPAFSRTCNAGPAR